MMNGESNLPHADHGHIIIVRCGHLEKVPIGLFFFRHLTPRNFLGNY